MAIENVKAFYKELEANEELQKKIAAADAAYSGDSEDKAAAIEAIVLPIAKKAGFDFTAEELLSLEIPTKEGEISEDELEAVAGGAAFCIVFGFGKAAGGSLTCNFIGVGFGYGK